MKSLLIVVSLFLGIIIPQAHVFSFLIQPLLMVILFFTFLQLETNCFYKNTLLVVLANLLIAIILYLTLAPFNLDIALSSFMTAITPSATASPAIAIFLKQNVEYLTLSVLLTNSFVSLAIPVLITQFLHQTGSLSSQMILPSVLFLFLTPLITAKILIKPFPKVKKYFDGWKEITFYIWNFLVFVASARATHFILYESPAQPHIIVAIALCSLGICILNFAIGKVIGGKRFAREASQALGHKNTMFSVWIALSFLNPIAALGPMFYVLYQNLYNSYQLVNAKR